MSTKYDVIIIGSGAGGGTLARHLAPSGKSILILERGDWLKREQQNWNVEEVFIKNRYVPKETWYDKTGKPFQPGLHYFVGGATKMFGAALYRLRKEDFGELKHYDGISPSWPIGYEDMEPYYTKALLDLRRLCLALWCLRNDERQLGVSLYDAETRSEHNPRLPGSDNLLGYCNRRAYALCRHRTMVP